MKKRSLALFGLVTVAATFALTACSNSGSSSSNSDKQVWRRMEGDIISSMD